MGIATSGQVGQPVSERERRSTPLEDRLLFSRFRKGDLAARDELVQRYLPLVSRLASRHGRSGESRDDLEQVAALGLLKAIDRYDPDRGAFAGYAIPTITGELKRHFRDTAWGVHVPRSTQENFLAVNAAVARLAAASGRPPTPREVANETRLSLEQVVEALDLATAYRPVALDAPRPGADDDALSLGDSLGDEDHHFDFVEIGQAVGPAFRQLPQREQRIIYLRFFEDRTQSEIGELTGVSQMHVSRLLRHAIGELSEAADAHVDGIE